MNKEYLICTVIDTPIVIHSGTKVSGGYELSGYNVIEGRFAKLQKYDNEKEALNALEKITEVEPNKTFTILTLYKNSPKKEIDFKDKIKVYIKEPNTPEYMQLWDKLDRYEIESWLNNKISNYNNISHDISVNNLTGLLIIRYNNKSEKINFRINN